MYQKEIDNPDNYYSRNNHRIVEESQEEGDIKWVHHVGHYKDTARKRGQVTTQAFYLVSDCIRRDLNTVIDIR